VRPRTLVRVGLASGGVVRGELRDGSVIVQERTYPAAEVEFFVPAVPSKIVCVGLNYRDHAQEMAMEIPPEPLLFLKPPSSLLRSGDAIHRRPEVTRLDYEGELAVVIGQRARNVSASESLDYIAGLTLANDVTARNFQLPNTQWTRAKGYDTFAPIGPHLVETKEWAGRQIRTLLNGAVVQSSNTDQLIFTVPSLIEHISSVMTLEEGDLILTGTPGGVGPMRAGDVVEVHIDGLGTLSNPVVDDHD
jgi:2-keto-4-pentenoate hydratase/2-oxohepta-3-ene-1,7-dioic acid hydratase in catechol pathway